jgi:hypothetical protein
LNDVRQTGHAIAETPQKVAPQSLGTLSDEKAVAALETSDTEQMPTSSNLAQIDGSIAGSFDSHADIQTITNGSIAESARISAAIISISRFHSPPPSHSLSRIPVRPSTFWGLRFSVAAERVSERR